MGRNPYHRMTKEQKLEYSRRLTNVRQDEPTFSAPIRPMRCFDCETAVPPQDFLRHTRETCPGLGEPNPRGPWITAAEAESKGVSRITLWRHAKGGAIRTCSERGRVRYYQPDVNRWLYKKGRIR